MKPIDKDQRLKLAVQKSGRLTDPSLELLKSCGLKLSRGRDQLMGFGENMPLDVLFVRDDDIPDLVQEDVCDLGPRRPQRARGKAPGAHLARAHGQLHRVAHARLRPLPAVAGGARRLQLRRPAVARGQAHRDHLPVHARALPAASATSRPTSSPCPARWRSRRASGAPISSATWSPPARRCRPITCVKWKPCSKARRC